jgi:hypothetical protein
MIKFKLIYRELFLKFSNPYGFIFMVPENIHTIEHKRYMSVLTLSKIKAKSSKI